MLNTFDFVREHFGPDAQTRLQRKLPKSLESLLDIRTNSWVSLDDLVACMTAAKATFAPADRFFYRTMGCYGGRHLRTLWVGIIFSEPRIALRCCQLLWGTFVGAGRLEVIPGQGAATLRVLDLPVAAPFCERLHGSFEGLFSVSAVPMRVEKRACTSRGDPYCELFVAREPSRRQEHERLHAARLLV